MGGNLEEIINEEINNDSKTNESTKYDGLITLNRLESKIIIRKEEIEDNESNDIVFKTNILFFIASIIFALYALISILSHYRIDKYEEDSTLYIFSISSITIALILIDASFGFSFGSLLRFKVFKEAYTNKKPFLKTYLILFILEILICLAITIIGCIKMEKTLFIGISICPLIFGFALFLIISVGIIPKSKN